MKQLLRLWGLDRVGREEESAITGPAPSPTSTGLKAVSAMSGFGWGGHYDALRAAGSRYGSAAVGDLASWHDAGRTITPKVTEMADGLRSVLSSVLRKLETIEKNPGPKRADVKREPQGQGREDFFENPYQLDWQEPRAPRGGRGPKQSQIGSSHGEITEGDDPSLFSTLLLRKMRRDPQFRTFLKKPSVTLLLFPFLCIDFAMCKEFLTRVVLNPGDVAGPLMWETLKSEKYRKKFTKAEDWQRFTSHWEPFFTTHMRFRDGRFSVVYFDDELWIVVGRIQHQLITVEKNPGPPKILHPVNGQAQAQANVGAAQARAAQGLNANAALQAIGAQPRRNAAPFVAPPRTVYDDCTPYNARDVGGFHTYYAVTKCFDYIEQTRSKQLRSACLPHGVRLWAVGGQLPASVEYRARSSLQWMIRAFAFGAGSLYVLAATNASMGLMRPSAFGGLSSNHHLSQVCSSASPAALIKAAVWFMGPMAAALAVTLRSLDVLVSYLDGPEPPDQQGIVRTEDEIQEYEKGCVVWRSTWTHIPTVPPVEDLRSPGQVKIKLEAAPRFYNVVLERMDIPKRRWYHDFLTFQVKVKTSLPILLDRVKFDTGRVPLSRGCFTDADLSVQSLNRVANVNMDPAYKIEGASYKQQFLLANMDVAGKSGHCLNAE
jgi:hypothetical protein